MVDVKISELPVAGSAVTTDQLEANQAGTSRSITVAQVGTALGYAPLASPVFTGDPQAPTPATADNDTSVATTAFVKAQGYLTTAAAGTTYLALTGGTLSGPGTLTGTTATFSGQLNASLAQISSATKGIRLVPGTTGSTIMGVDQTGTGSYQPLSIDALTTQFLLSGVPKATLDSSGLTVVGTVFAPGAQLQMVSVVTGAVATGTTLIPIDDTIPQITEGDQYMTLAITPKSATSKLLIEVAWTGSNTSTTSHLSVALFQDATANALAAVVETYPSAQSMVNITFTHSMTSGTTSATTFRVRAGSAIAGTTTFNGVASGRLFGGVMASSIVIREVA